MQPASREIRLYVEGMDCASCARKIDTAVRRLPDIDDVAVSVARSTMTVTSSGEIDLPAIQQLLRSLGYTAQPLAAAPAGAPHRSSCQDATCVAEHAPHETMPATGSSTGWLASPQARLTLACGLAVVLAFVLAWLVPATAPWGYVLAIAMGLTPIARQAWAGARHGTPFSIETLMTVAAIGAIIIGAAEEAAAVVLLFLIGEQLEGLAARRARASIAGLAALMPKTALREDAAGTTEVAANTLVPGNIVQVRAGARIPADGQILTGQSAVDEAPVTGESIPASKAAGDPVYAGTINGDGLLRVRVTASGADNTIARIITLVERAQEAKAPTERLIERFSRWYTPAVMLVALLVALVPPLAAAADWQTWIYRGLAVLLIGCPCALVISTPAAIAAALAAGARRGLLMKGGAVLEQLGKVDLVAFDKTGTLTEGRPQLTDIAGAGHSESRVLALAAALESGTSHPLAQAIVSRATAEQLPRIAAADIQTEPGHGISGRIEGQAAFLGSPQAAQARATLPAELRDTIQRWQNTGKTVAVLTLEGTAIGALALRDQPRADARAGIARLQTLGASALMLTGDHRQTAQAIGADLGLPVHAELLPADKLRIVNELQAQGRVVASVGDGINDAPALAAADIGIAMGGGTDVALETADAAVLHGRVGDVAAMIALSRASVRNITQNISIALGLKAVFLVTTVLGITGLWPAILADTGATVLVTANALRLLGWRSSTD